MDSTQEQLLRYHRSRTVRYLNSIYNTKSLFEIIVKERDEKIHSRMLKWLFELDELPCTWHDYPIMNLLYRILERADEQNKVIDTNLKTYLLSGQAKITVNEVKLEVATQGVKVNKQSGLIDLLFDCSLVRNNKQTKLTICIENKVDSEEHDYQTWKYYAYLAGVKEAQARLGDSKDIVVEGESEYKKEKDEKLLFVLLTPHSENEMDNNHCSCSEYIHINYQDIMDYVLSELLKLKGLNPRIQFITKEYINTLSIPYINNKNKIPIMAMNNEHSKLLTQFWEENKPLILSALNAFKDDNNQDEEERVLIKDALNLLSKKNNSFSLKIGGQQYHNLKMWEVAKKVCDYLLLNCNYSINDINEKLGVGMIKDLLIDNTEYQKITKPKDQSRWKKLETSDYYVSSQWYYNQTPNIKRPNFPEFIEKVKRLGVGMDIIDNNNHIAK